MKIENIIKDGKITEQRLTVDADLQECVYSAEAILDIMSQTHPDNYNTIALVDAALMYLKRACEMLEASEPIAD